MTEKTKGGIGEQKGGEWRKWMTEKKKARDW